MLLCLFLLVSPWLLAEGRPRTVDQVIEHAMVGTYADDLLEKNDTVLVELDILYTKEQWDEIQRQRHPESGDRSKRKAISYKTHRWTDKVLPYTIDYSFSSSDRVLLQAAMDDYQKWTCVSFRPRGYETNYISIVTGGGCSSYVGMIGGAQPVTLAPNCRYHATIVHEFGHAVGFQHEQCRGDRDSYISVYTNNVWPGMEFNFDKYGTNEANNYGIPYDYMSVMHYGETAFSANGQLTIIAKDKYYQKRMGTAPTLSFPDLKLANHIYECAAHCPAKSCPGDGYLDKNCNCMCKGSRDPVKPCSDSGEEDEDECEDSHPSCYSWAQSGECDANPVWMGDNCKKSCGTCDGGSGTTCVDNDENCYPWAQAGYCETNQHTKDNCPRSCGLC